MKSSSGNYYAGLDHIRALAAFMVFVWHFIRVPGGQEQPPPFFPLSLLGEGHTGVALFMVLSGYLFAKLLEGKDIHYWSFIWNRALRLLPLLILVIIAVGIRKYLAGDEIFPYVKRVLSGVIKPGLPHGGWSITTEFHFYLVLPILLFLARKSKHLLWLMLLTTITIRVVLYSELGEIQSLSYWTIVGRIDQFLLGIIAFKYRSLVSGRHLLAFIGLLGFSLIYWQFDAVGGFYKYIEYPSPSPLWIILPTIEGLAYGLLVAWYDNSFSHSTSGVSRFVASIGTYSFSIYLLHFFFVFIIAELIHTHVLDISDVNLAILVGIAVFPVMIPIGYLSHRYLELPFLKYRTRYIIEKPIEQTMRTALQEGRAG